MITAALFPCPLSPDDCHDSNAAIIADDRIYAYEEEKLTGTKNENTVKMAERSLFTGLKELGVTPGEVDRWVLPVPAEKPSEDGLYLVFNHMLKAFPGSRAEFPEWFANHVTFVPHHTAHAALAVHASGFEDCAWISIDGGGDWGDMRSAVWGEFRDGKLIERGAQPGWHGLGSFHSYLTEALGFAQRENGKTSGLAAYGSVQPELYDALRSLLTVDGVSVDFARQRLSRSPVNLAKVKPQEYCRAKIVNTYPSHTNVLTACLPYLPHEIAATGEQVLKDVMHEVLAWVRTQTGLRRVVFSGGLFQNVALNRAIVLSGLFDEYYFPMASADGGQALGAALHMHEPKLPPKRMSAYLGPSFDEAGVVDLCDRFRLRYEVVANAPAEAAALIASGQVVGWFQGRAEYGPRSLGARSILADPRDLNVKKRINQLLKRREWFMPYAPAVLEELLGEWFTPPHPSPYMQVALDAMPGKQSLIPAAVHVDGTCRAQVVSRSDAPLFWDLINEFRALTGLPVVLNTSFNRHGIATISTPRQAIEHLLEGCMDHLFVGNVRISFAENRLTGAQSLDTVEEDEMLVEDCRRRLGAVQQFGTPEQVAAYRARLDAFLAEKAQAKALV